MGTVTHCELVEWQKLLTQWKVQNQDNVQSLAIGNIFFTIRYYAVQATDLSRQDTGSKAKHRLWAFILEEYFLLHENGVSRGEGDAVSGTDY
jgi:hypothetical protein